MAEIFLTVSSVAERLHLHPLTIRKHLREGRIRGVKLGKEWRIAESALTELARSMAVSSAGSSLSEERKAAIRAARGSLAHLPGSVEDFLANKRAEVERENHTVERSGTS